MDLIHLWVCGNVLKEIALFVADLFHAYIDSLLVRCCGSLNTLVSACMIVLVLA